MPELPEVHTTATMLNELISGLTISDTWTDLGGKTHVGKDHIKDPKFFQKFRVQITGAKIKNVDRRGKNVLIHLDIGQTILVHMKMTGQLLYGRYKKSKVVSTQSKATWEAVSPVELKDPFSRFVHFVISFENGRHMVLSDMRKFAKITLLETATAHLSGHLADIGPEPLEESFDFKKFQTRLFTRPKGRIKQVLMEPAVVSGIGNIYSDEILWDSDVHPLSAVSKIPEKELRKIFASTKLLLKKGIDFGGDSMSDYRTPIGTKGSFQHHHQAYHKFGEKCAKKNCRGTISKLKAGGRTAHFCDTHQECYN